MKVGNEVSVAIITTEFCCLCCLPDDWAVMTAFSAGDTDFATGTKDSFPFALGGRDQTVEFPEDRSVLVQPEFKQFSRKSVRSHCFGIRQRLERLLYLSQLVPPVNWPLWSNVGAWRWCRCPASLPLHLAESERISPIFEGWDPYYIAVVSCPHREYTGSNKSCYKVVFVVCVCLSHKSIGPQPYKTPQKTCCGSGPRLLCWIRGGKG